MAKPKIHVRPPPVDPEVAQQFIATGSVQERPQTSADLHLEAHREIIPPPIERPKTSIDVQRKRAPKGTKVLIEREGGRVRRRMTVYLPPELADRFMAWCSSNGREASHAVGEAITAFLKSQRGK